MILTLLATVLVVQVPAGQEPICVTSVVARRDLSREVRLPATIKPWEEATLVAHVTGYVDKVLVREGAWVGRGDALVTIDVPLMSQEIAQKKAVVRAAEATVAEAEAEARAKRSAVDMRRAGRDRARAEVDLRTIRLERLVRLQEGKAATQEQVDDARGMFEIARQGVAEQEVAIVSAQAEVAAAEAALEAKRAQVAVARADLERMQELISYATIRCPYEKALVYERLVDPGVLVRANSTPILHLMNIERVRVRMDLDERDAPHVRAGSGVILAPDAPSLPSRRAEVSRVTRALDPDTHTMMVEVDLLNSDHELYPGMFVHADLEVYRRPGALVIPASALQMRAGESFVHVVEGGVLKRISVELGLDDGITCEIVSGLEEGAEVVLSGAESLAEGTKVRTRRESGS